jgi:hypothetical protein
MTRIFVGRKAEIDELIDWVTDEPPGPDGRRAGLLIGHSGTGKSVLLEEFESLCILHTPQRWFVHRGVVTRDENATAFLDRLLAETHWLFRGKPLARGPDDSRHLKALLEAVPQVGKLLAALAGDDPRPTWERFVDYLAALAQALEQRDERFCLLIDPDRRMADNQPDEWMAVAARVPRAFAFSLRSDRTM